MKKAGLVITIILALLMLGVGFTSTTAALYITQPASSATTTVRFEVKSGDTTNIVAQHLQDDGLIRNALAFRLYARFKHLDTGIEPGVYLLNPSMTMGEIITTLQKGKPDEQLAGVPDALRATQYAQYFTSLPNFNANDFNSIVKTGVLPDGTKLWQKYWFVEDPSIHKPFDALEGYLYPDHYYFDVSATATVVVEKMVEELGSQFCPGPASNPTQYIDTEADCKAHAAMVGNTDIFTSMENAYHTKDDVLAIYDTLIMASLTAREIRSLSDAQGVASTYHNRFLYMIHASNVDGGTAGYMGSDPSAEYARDSDNPPSDGHWWKDLTDQGKNIDPKNPYNLDANTGMPPGPIANAVQQEIFAAAAPTDPSKWPYFYFVSDKCGKIYYGKDYNDFQTNVVPKENTGNC